MPYKRVYRRKRFRKRRYKKRYGPRKERRKIIPRGLRQSTYMFKKIYNTQIIGAAATTLDFSDNVSISKVNNFAELASVFRSYRINKVQVKIVCPYSIGQSGIGANSLFQIHYKTKQLSNEVMPANKAEWGEISAHKRKTFLPQKGNQCSIYFTPFTWLRQEVFPASTNMRDRKVYKAWYTCPTTTASSMQYAGIMSQITKVDGTTIVATEKFEIQTTLYIQARGII